MAQEQVVKPEEYVKLPGEGFAIFGAAMMVLVGIFGIFEGVAALINGEFFVVGREYLYSYDLGAWGWGHILWGTLMALAGFGVFGGKVWARTFGIILAIMSAIANFAFIPYYPFWAILIIILDMAIIWGLANFNPKKALEKKA